MTDKKNKIVEQKTTKTQDKKTNIVPTKNNKMSQNNEGKLIVVIRIAGEVKVKPEVKTTLDMMRLRKKYSCVFVNGSNESNMGMLKRVRFSVAYGEIEKETLVKLIEARGKVIGDKKIKASEVSEEILKGKRLEDLGLKPFFRLHPPRGGIDSKIQYPKGVLGNNHKDINKLLTRML